jgi:23S rRNA pseudouridine2604 synthase
MDETYPMRINKYLAHKNYCTRREADTYIRKGKVLINGRKAVLGDKVTESDTVEAMFIKREYRYFAYNKPKGVVTHSPEEGQKGITESVPITGVFPLGRLDKESHGLMILTDDGRITDDLLNPAKQHEKEYRVRTAEKLPGFFKKRMEAGVKIEGYTTKPCKVDILDDHTFRIRLTEGKKHQIRRMCAALGLVVHDLERKRILNIRLATLRPGEHRAIEGRELKDFLEALK